MTTSETLNKAADVVETQGWQDRPGTPESRSSWDWNGTGYPVCVEGAIFAAVGHPRSWASAEINACPAGLAVRAYLGVHTLWLWNDERGRTAEQVIATLRAAALIEAAKESAADPLVAHLAHHAVDIIAAELDTTAAPL